MAEWSIASDLKSEELKKFREFESHSLLTDTFNTQWFKKGGLTQLPPFKFRFYKSSAKSTSITFPEVELVFELLFNSFFKNTKLKILITYFKFFIILVVIA
jgi:hypothetical protein